MLIYKEKALKTIKLDLIIKKMGVGISKVWLTYREGGSPAFHLNPRLSLFIRFFLIFPEPLHFQVYRSCYHHNRQIE